ncbi:MAG: chromosome partitioning protein ParB [Anaerolineae bacterium]|nr:chromosome partitioning protein ParB [Anaerolineae bacterium]
MEFTAAAAQRYAAAHQLEDWIHTYLTTGKWANEALSTGLKRQRRWWAGPLEVRLDALQRCTGPEPDQEFRVDPAGWERYVTQIEHNLTDPIQVPPLVVEYRAGILSIRDGNHRYEAMRRKGWDCCWVIIWYNTRRDYSLHRLACADS